MRFVDNLFGSKSRSQIMRFFFRNRRGIFSVRDVAAHLRLRDKEVAKEIKILLRSGIVKKSKPSNGREN